jgi:hypothetical protein
MTAATLPAAVTRAVRGIGESKTVPRRRSARLSEPNPFWVWHFIFNNAPCLFRLFRPGCSISVRRGRKLFLAQKNLSPQGNRQSSKSLTLSVNFTYYSFSPQAVREPIAGRLSDLSPKSVFPGKIPVTFLLLGPELTGHRLTAMGSFPILTGFPLFRTNNPEHLQRLLYFSAP